MSDRPSMSYDEQYQRRVDTMEWKPNAMTEEERLQNRRFEAYYAFETMPDKVYQSRLHHFGLGQTDHLPKLPQT